jgi:hypothetical protein
MAKKSQVKTLKMGEMVTCEVAIPHCGLDVGETRRMKVTRELQHCLDKGLWKVKEK